MMRGLDISSREVLRLTSLVVLTVVVVLAGVWLLVKLWSVVVLLGLALLLGVALLPAVHGLMRLTRKRVPAVLLLALGFLTLLGLFGVLVVPPLVEQGRSLYDDAPDLQARLAREAETRGQATLGERIRAFTVKDAVSTDLLVRTGIGALSGL